MAAPITSISIGTVVSTEDVLINFSNGASICARLVAQLEDSVLILHNHKLVRIFNADKSCKVLKEGVSIR